MLDETKNVMIGSSWISPSSLTQMTGFALTGFAAGHFFKSLNLNPVHGLIHGGIHYVSQKFISQIYAKQSKGTHQEDYVNPYLAFTFKYIVPAVISYGATNFVITHALSGAGLALIPGIVMPIALGIIAEPVTDWAIKAAKKQLKKDSTQEAIEKISNGCSSIWEGIKGLPEYIPSPNFKGCCAAMPGSKYVSSFFARFVRIGAAG